jgi:ABC-type transporter Mla MlaB component
MKDEATREAMLRISTKTTARQITLTLEGQITGRWLEELQRECDRAVMDAAPERRVVLDVAGVSWIDAAGVALVRDLLERRVAVANCSLYLTELLKDVTNGDARKL